ncbi:unnamed protein product [Echinostoma caproni]|uniref:Ig-like domain-containing protein n=1 Tax=Echinostoma caproni TaxID=27848 RepID=A0A183A771_9TREM|nr:unnamed protein product [Echinostoma caproni]
MVCANRLFPAIPVSAALRPQVDLNPKTSVISSASNFSSSVKLLYKPAWVFQPEWRSQRQSRALKSPAPASKVNVNAQSKRSSGVDSKTFDCDHYSVQILPQLNLRRPCFLGTVPTRITVDEGDRILLQCIVYNVNFSTVVISWWKEGWFRELSLGLETYNERYRLPRVSYQDWTLQINNAQPDDSGVYVCQINLEQIVEKFFEVQVREMRIEGQNEGYVGTTLRLFCIVQSVPGSTTTALIWSHGSGSQRYFLSPTASSRTDMEYLLRSFVDTDISEMRGSGQIDIRIADEENIKITTAKQGNHTIRSELVFAQLTLDHAGVWRCSKLTYPIGPITEEAKMMVYVREYPFLNDLIEVRHFMQRTG